MCTVYIYLYGWLSTDSKTKKKKGNLSEVFGARISHGGRKKRSVAIVFFIFCFSICESPHKVKRKYGHFSSLSLSVSLSVYDTRRVSTSPRLVRNNSKRECCCLI